jgi:site-specific DNA-methyltransferase (cytosine-N4-specific)
MNTQRDRAEIARIRHLLAEHAARTLAACIGIGEVIAKHFQRKQLSGELKHGDKQAYAKQHFDADAEYLARFARLYIMQDQIADAERLQAERKWLNLYLYEPQRTNALLTWFAKTATQSATSNTQIRKQFTEARSITVLTGDCRTVLHGIEANSVQAVITSPPYHGLRDYDHAAQIGLEDTVAEYIATLVQDVFRPIKGILRDDGIVWVNIGDRIAQGAFAEHRGWASDPRPARTVADDRPRGNLLFIPARFAMAMQNDGWMARSEVIWNKLATTQTAGRRPRVQHEPILMFTKSMRYRYYKDAVQEPRAYPTTLGPQQRRNGRMARTAETKDLGTVWRIAAANSPKKGVSAFPTDIVERMILLSTLPGDRVLDPFGGGAGTVGVVAKLLSRRATLIEVNPDYAATAQNHILNTPSSIPLDDAAD